MFVILRSAVVTAGVLIVAAAAVAVGVTTWSALMAPRRNVILFDIGRRATGRL